MLGRRAVLKGGGALFGLGKPTPSRFPYAGRPQPGTGVAPSSGQVFRGRLVIVFGPAGQVEGVFVYAPGTTPAAGNPPVVALTQSNTDPFGNSVRPGDANPGGTLIAIGTVTAGGTAQYVQTDPGDATHHPSIRFGTGDSAETTPGKVTVTSPGGSSVTRVMQFILNAPVFSTGSFSGAQMTLTSASEDGTTTQPSIALLASAVGGGTTTTVTVAPTGASVTGGPFTSTAGTAANPTLVETDGWQTGFNYFNSWAATVGGYPNQYRLLPDGYVHLMFDVSGGTVLTDGANIFQLTTAPTSAYTPKQLTPLTGIAVKAGATAAQQNTAYVQMTTSRVVQCENIPAGTTRLVGSVFYPAAF